MEEVEGVELGLLLAEEVFLRLLGLPVEVAERVGEVGGRVPGAGGKGSWLLAGGPLLECSAHDPSFFL